MKKYKGSKKAESQSVNRKLVIPIFILILMQCVIFVLAILGAGVIRELRQNAYYNLYTTAHSAQNTLGDYMENKWSRYSNYKEVIRIAKEDYASYLQNPEQGMEISRPMADAVQSLLNNSNVSGAFVIYDEAAEDTQKKTGLFLRDMEPDIVILDNSDLRLDYGPPEIANEMQITLGNYWRHAIPLNEEEPSSDFYYDMKKAVMENPHQPAMDFGRWEFSITAFFIS